MNKVFTPIKSVLFKIALVFLVFIHIDCHSQTFNGPVTITTGGTYSGNWQSNDPYTPAINIQTAQPVIIQNSNIISKGIGIEVGFPGANVSVQNTCAIGLNPGIMGMTAGRFLKSTGSKNIVVRNTNISSTSGIYILNFVGDGSANQQINILYNNFHDIMGMASSVTGYRSDNVGITVTHAIQFDKVQNLPNVEVAWNQVINDPFNSACSDVFNFYLSSGTPTSPMRIHDNYIQGSYPPNPLTEPFSGGGIIADGNPATLADATAWLDVYNNQVIATSNYGIAIACGHDNNFYNNRVVACGYLSPGGGFISSQNIGAYVFNIHSNPFFSNNNMYNNAIAWNKWNNTTNTVFRNDRYFPNCVAGGCTGNTSLTNTLNNATETNEYLLWLAKLQNNNITLGASNCFQSLGIGDYFESADISGSFNGSGKLNWSLSAGAETPVSFTVYGITAENSEISLGAYSSQSCMLNEKKPNVYALPLENDWGEYSYLRIEAHFPSGESIESPILKFESTDLEITLSPNPFEGQLYLCSVGTTKPKDIKLYTLQGVLLQSIQCSPTMDCIQMGEELLPGMYIICVATDLGTKSYKVVKK